MYCKALLQSKRQGIQRSLKCIVNEIEKYLQLAPKFEIWLQTYTNFRVTLWFEKIESTKNISVYIIYLYIVTIVIVQIVLMAGSFYKAPI